MASRRRREAKKRRRTDPSGAWIAVPGRRKGLPRFIVVGRVQRRDAKGRFRSGWIPGTERRIELPARPYWRFYLGKITYHKEDGKGGRTYFLVNGIRVTREQAQWVMAAMIEDSVPNPPASFKSDLDPVLEDVEDDDKVEFECNDADMSLADIQGAYEFAGADKKGNDVEELVEPDVGFAEDSEASIELFRKWEHDTREAPIGRWALRDKKIGLAISYYAVAHKMTYEDTAKFGVVIRTPFAPISREAYLELRDRMRLAQEASEEEVEFVAAGFFLIVKVLT